MLYDSDDNGKKDRKEYEKIHKPREEPQPVTELTDEDKERLRVAVWDGRVTLTRLALRREALFALGLPIDIAHGFVDKVEFHDGLRALGFEVEREDTDAVFDVLDDAGCLQLPREEELVAREDELQRLLAEERERAANFTLHPEVRHAALWMRERFWQAVAARERSGAAEAVGGAAPAARRSLAEGGGGGGVAYAADALTVSVHMRRGDVTWLDKFGRPSSRWVDVEAMLEVLRGVRSVLRVPLAPPAVRLHLFSEARGWGSNDTEALRSIAPHAQLHLESDAPSTIDALVAMSRSDVLVMGSSGFSTWSAIFSCGVKCVACVHVCVSHAVSSA